MSTDSLRAHVNGQIDGHEILHARSAAAELELERQLKQAAANTQFLAGKLTAFREVLAAIPKSEAQPGSGSGTR